jgi:hypothetical protein
VTRSFCNKCFILLDSSVRPCKVSNLNWICMIFKQDFNSFCYVLIWKAHLFEVYKRADFKKIKKLKYIWCMEFGPRRE